MLIIILLSVLGILVISALIGAWNFLSKRKGKGISIIIPFRESNAAPERLRNLMWLVSYWRKQLPGAQLVIGEDPCTDKPFSKAVAINRAAEKAKGDVFVIVDADGYIAIDVVLHCVEEIRNARKRGQKLWFVPYRKFYRLNEEISSEIIRSDPQYPFFPKEINGIDILNDTDPHTGHHYGAMIQILPKEAFKEMGGWDERFRGWGGEDHAAMRATDTLYSPHKTRPTCVLHLWHPMIGDNGPAKIVNWKERRWEGQDDPTKNYPLSYRYYGAYNKPKTMRQLVEEYKKEIREEQLYCCSENKHCLSN